MNRLVTILFLFCALRLFGAAGDIVSCDVRTDGWSVDIQFDGLSSNGTYTLGFVSVTNTTSQGTNIIYKPGPSTPYLLVTSPGYDSSGATQLVQRTVYFTEAVRLPYPDEGEIDESPSGADIVCRVALDRSVYVNDSSITLTCPAGFYDDGTPNNAASGLSCGNNSTLAYPLPVGNWSWPGNQLVTGSVMRLRAVGFHSSAGQNGQPLACMQFIAEGLTSGTKITNTVTKMLIDHSLPDPILTGEYVSDFDTSSFTDNELLQCDFVAYPFVGSPSAVLDTRDGNYTWPAPSTITNLCDPDNDYSGFVAVVGIGSGNDSNGRATNTTYDAVQSGHYFLTAVAAWNEIANSNNTHRSHNDPGGGFVYLDTTTASNWSWTGGTLSAGAKAQAKVWATTLTYPGQGRAYLTNRANDRNVGHMTKIQDVHLDWGDPAVPFYQIGSLWVDNCKVDLDDSTAFFWDCTNIFITHSEIVGADQGLKPASSDAGTMFLRGNDLTSFNDEWQYSIAIANIRRNTNGSSFNMTDYGSGSASPTPNFCIIYNNRMTFLNSSPCLSFGASSDVEGGIAIIQNIFEKSGDTAASIARFGSSGNNESTNVLIWHNVIIGERIADMGSSGAETTTIWRENWSLRNNIFDLTGFKKDHDTPVDADRVGNWQLMYQVDCSGNIFVENLVNAAGGQFPPDFVGFYSHYPSLTNLMNFPRFRDRKAYDGAKSQGNGDYRVYLNAPGQNMQRDWVLPFDIDGNPRGAKDPIGPHATGSSRGGMF